MNFESLVGHINQVQDVLQAQAAHAVNLSLTSRNWLVGYYIVEYEQHGEDRAKYGDNLINRLAKDINRKGFEPRTLRLYRRIYLIYPQLGTEIGTYLHNNSLGVLDASGNSIWQSATAKLQMPENQVDEIWQSAITKLEEWSTPADWLFYKLNYTSLAYLTNIEEPLKRTFYEQETIRGCWTVRELDRQVSSRTRGDRPREFQEINRKGFEPRSLHMYRRIYLVYPQLGSVIESFLQKNNLSLSDSGISSILQSVTAKLQNAENQSDTILQSAIAKLEES